MSSHTDAASGSHTGRTESEDASSEGSDPPRTICIVCQRPLDRNTDDLWQGEPVHFECGAELRCGVSLGNRSDG